MLSRPFVMNEQVAEQIFETIPQQGLVALIIDTYGKIWPSDSEYFQKLNIREDLLKEICRKIDDGQEPVVTHENNCGVVASQLSTDKNNCGYIIIVLPQYTPESIMADINLIEVLLNQFNLIASLIENNNRFFELQANRYKADSFDIITLN
jgi:hypothetical protein